MEHTRQKILEVSLALFSVHGFSAVSVRDICKKVGVKESSLYYHFQNKRAILDELLHRFEAIAEEQMARLEQALAGQGALPEASGLETVSACFFEEYWMDDFCNKMLRLLQIEQHHSADMQQLYLRWMFEEPLQFQSRVFGRLKELGTVSEEDERYLAVQYYAPICLFAQRWLLSGALSEEGKRAFREAAYGHIRAFCRSMGGAVWPIS